jgi:hypothetical protein
MISSDQVTQTELIMIALQNPPVIRNSTQSLVQFASYSLQVAVSDCNSPEAVQLRTLAHNSAYCVWLGQKGGNNRYLLSDAGLKLFRLSVRQSRRAALVDLAPVSIRAYEERIIELLVAEYGESRKEAAHFVESHDFELSNWREEGISAAIAARLLFDEIRETYTCAECGCDSRVGRHQNESGYHAPSYQCSGERRCW